MKQRRWDRWGALSGFAVVVFGAAASAFERAPVTPADYAANRSALLTQSMLFLAGAAVTLWFLGSLRAHLLRFEPAPGRLSAVAFGAGLVWVGLNMLAQAFQIGVAEDETASAPRALLATMNAVFTIANLPFAVTLVAVAMASFRYRAFASWLGWFALVAAATQLTLWLATVVSTGPLASDGWLSFALYPFFLIWLVPATVVMVTVAGRPSGDGRRAATVEGADR